MDKRKDNEILLATKNLLEFVVGVVDLAKLDAELLNNVYREISEATGTDVAIEMYRLFKGQQITFPVRFLNPRAERKGLPRHEEGYRQENMDVG